MLFDKVIKRLAEKGEMDIDDFRREIYYNRFDKDDVKKIIKDLKASGSIEIIDLGKRGTRIKIKNGG